MCIICQMQAAGASEEVLTLAKTLFDALEFSIDVHERLANSWPKMYDDVTIARIVECAKLMAQPNGVKVQLVGIFAEAGESIEEAIKRTMEEQKLASAIPPSTLKH